MSEQLQIGVWFDGPGWRTYKGNPVVLDVENLYDPETPKVRVLHVSRCPACDPHRFEVANGKRVVRWLILPA